MRKAKINRIVPILLLCKLCHVKLFLFCCHVGCRVLYQSLKREYGHAVLLLLHCIVYTPFHLLLLHCRPWCHSLKQWSTSHFVLFCTFSSVFSVHLLLLPCRLWYQSLKRLPTSRTTPLFSSSSDQYSSKGQSHHSSSASLCATNLCCMSNRDSCASSSSCHQCLISKQALCHDLLRESVDCLLTAAVVLSQLKSSCGNE